MKLFLALFAILLVSRAAEALKMQIIQKGEINEGSPQKQAQVAQEVVKDIEDFDDIDGSQYLHDHQNIANLQVSPPFDTGQPYWSAKNYKPPNKEDNGRLTNKIWTLENDEQRPKRITFELQSTNKDELSPKRINNQEKPYQFSDKINLKAFHYKRQKGGERRALNILHIEADTQQGTNIIRICEDLKDLKKKTLLRKRQLLQNSRLQKIDQGWVSSKQQDIVFYCLLALLSIFAAIPLLALVFKTKKTHKNTSQKVKQQPKEVKHEQSFQGQRLLS